MRRQPSQYASMVLSWFWDQFQTCASFEERIKLLKQASETKSIPHRNTREVREDFNESKSDIWRLKGKKCVACGKPAKIRHHLILIQNGGVNIRRNIVALCKGCHALIHPWLAEPIRVHGTGSSPVTPAHGRVANVTGSTDSPEAIANQAKTPALKSANGQTAQAQPGF